LRQRFIEAMDDDLNSSGALAVVFELARPLRGLANRLDRGDNAGITASESALLRSRWLLLRELAAVLGLRAEATAEDEASNSAVDTTAIEAAIAARQAAKQAKNYAEADRIRSELTAQGIELIDKPGGSTEWRHS
jgi:cysteinyl-tRNA synthetase